MMDFEPRSRCPHCYWALPSPSSSPPDASTAIAVGQQPRRNGLALIAALRAGDLAEVRALLSKPYDANTVDERRVTPLMVAAYRGYTDVCRSLLEKGADARYYVTRVYSDDDKDGGTSDEDDRASSRAVMSGNPSTIDLIRRAELRTLWSDALAVRETDPAWFKYVGPQFLLKAAELGMLSLCAEMLDSGVSAEPADGSGSDALRVAAENHDLRLSLLLVAMGAKIDSVGSEGLFSKEFSEAFSRERQRLADGCCAAP